MPDDKIAPTEIVPPQSPNSIVGKSYSIAKEFRVQLTGSAILVLEGLIPSIFHVAVPASVYLYTVAGIICWTFGGLWRKERAIRVLVEQERDHLKQIAPVMVIDILGVKRYPIPYDGTDSWAKREGRKFHVFINVSIKLDTPKSVQVLEYNVKLVRGIRAVPTKRHDDIANIWEFWDSDSVLDEGHHGSIPILKSDLTWNSLEQGWLHFVTQERVTVGEMDESLVHLTVVTAHGSPSVRSLHSVLSIFRVRPAISLNDKRLVATTVDATEETDSMWLGVDEIWRFKKNHVTRPQIIEFHYIEPSGEEENEVAPEESIYLWLHCKVCKQFHRGDEVSPLGYPISAAKTRDIECPDNPGKYKFYGQQGWVQGKLRHEATTNQ